MKKKDLSKGKFLMLLAGIILLASLTVTVPACKKKEKADTSLLAMGSDTASFKMNCLKITKAQFQQWVDSASPKKLKFLLLQLHSTATSGVKLNMRAMGYPGQTMTNVGAFGNRLLDIDTSVAPVAFPAATFPNNFADLVACGIMNPNGTLTNFSVVRFRPTLLYAPLISFDVEVEMEDGTVMARGTNPCPPCQYCNPPSCFHIED